jgi:hypothetical protein
MCCWRRSRRCPVKYTDEGSITVEARAFDEPHGLRDADGIAVEIIVADTGCGISSAKLESIFREFEQVESMGQAPDNNEGVGEWRAPARRRGHADGAAQASGSRSSRTSSSSSAGSCAWTRKSARAAASRS